MPSLLLMRLGRCYLGWVYEEGRWGMNSSHDHTKIDQGHPLLATFPALQQKFVVDFANGIDVVRDINRVQELRTGLFARMYDGLTGKTTVRQAKVNACVADGLEGSLKWLGELSQSLALTNQSLTRVHLRVKELQNNVARLAHFSADMRATLKAVDTRLTKRTEALAQELARVDLLQRAQLQMQQVFNKWAAGRLDMLPLLARPCVCLEELYWGDFGSLITQSTDHVLCNGLVQQLTDLTVKQMRDDAKRLLPTSDSPRHSTQLWLARPQWRSHAELSQCDAMDAVAYQSNWCSADEQPFTYVATQQPVDWPLAMPCLLYAARAAPVLVRERFEESRT